MRCAAWLLWTALPLMGLDESALNGAYHYRYLQVRQADAGGALAVSQALGTLLFDGRGGYTEGAQRRGYMVDERGVVTMPAPGGDYAIEARVSSDTGVLLGAGTENSGIHDLLVAVRTSVAPSVPRGVYHAVVLLLPSNRPDAAVSAQASFDIGEAQLQMSGDGTGNLTLPLSTDLPTRSYNVAASGDGLVLIGSPRSGRGLLVAVAASEAAPSGVYWTMAMALEGGRVGAGIGSMRVEGGRRLRLAQRWNSGGRAYDYVGVRPIGASGFGAGTLVAATTAAEEPALMLAVRVPSITGSGLFVHPQEVRHAALDGPVGAPIAPGALAATGGSGFTASPAVAAGVPLPLMLAGTRLEIGGQAAGLLAVSESLIQWVTPSALRAGEEKIVVRNGAATSMPVRTRIAAASPGIFSEAGTGAAVATHADFRRITAESPAQVGETVVLFGTGLGLARPAVSVWIGGRPAEVHYSGPTGLPGLDQVNVRIPLGAATGEAIPVTVSDGESLSDTVTIAVVQ